MTFWQFIGLNLMALFWMVVGAAIYYRGQRQQDPLPRVTLPKAGLLFRRGEKKPAGETDGDDENGVPESMRRA